MIKGLQIEASGKPRVLMADIVMTGWIRAGGKYYKIFPGERVVEPGELVLLTRGVHYWNARRPSEGMSEEI